MTKTELEGNRQHQPNYTDHPGLAGRFNWPTPVEPEYQHTHKNNCCDNRYLVRGEIGDRLTVSTLTQYPIGYRDDGQQ